MYYKNDERRTKDMARDLDWHIISTRRGLHARANHLSELQLFDEVWNRNVNTAPLQRLKNIDLLACVEIGKKRDQIRAVKLNRVEGVSVA